MALENRKKLILKAVVDAYIETAEPVGSKLIASRKGFDISSATIRNEMADLEKEGYLIHPHTSAGRVPTDKGYREYVDNLITIPEFCEDEQMKVREYFRFGFEEITNLIESASSALSNNTGYTSITLTPRLRKSRFKQMKMLMIEPGKVLMVVVLEQGVVKDRLTRIDKVIDDSQLLKISNAIEEGLCGKSLEDITFIAVETAGKKTEIPENLLKQVLYEAYISIKQSDNLGIYMEGINKIFSYPEFCDIKKAKDFMDTLAERGIVAGYLDEVNRSIEGDKQEDISTLNKDKPAYMIRIGQEISLSGFKDCSFVTTTYKLDETTAGSIGVIGPKRMKYADVISRIGFVRKILNEEICKIAAGS